MSRATVSYIPTVSELFDEFLKQSRIDYDALAKWQIPELPKLPKGLKKKAQRQGLVTEKEFAAVIGELTKESRKVGKTPFTAFASHIFWNSDWRPA